MAHAGRDQRSSLLASRFPTSYSSSLAIDSVRMSRSIRQNSGRSARRMKTVLRRSDWAKSGSVRIRSTRAVVLPMAEVRRTPASRFQVAPLGPAGYPGVHFDRCSDSTTCIAVGPYEAGLSDPTDKADAVLTTDGGTT